VECDQRVIMEKADVGLDKRSKGEDKSQISLLNN
jgi:hypothetical protein